MVGLMIALAWFGTADADEPQSSPSLKEGIRWPGEGGTRIPVTVAITIIDFASINPEQEVFEMAGDLDLARVDPTLVLPQMAGGRNPLPKVPYLTFADTFSLTVFADVLAVIFAVTAIHFVHTRQSPDRAERLQKFARRGFPASFVVIIALQALYSLW